MEKEIDMISGVQVDDFINFTSYSSYLLGLLWADGYVTKNGRPIVRIELMHDDFIVIENVFEQVGKWSIYNRDREGRQRQRIASVSGEKLNSFLKSLDYCEKSYKSADKVLDLVPNEFKHYWWRGLVDGDGCFYINKKYHNYQFTVGGSYNQDWTFVEDLLKKLGIFYRVLRRVQKKSKNSIVQITRRKDIGKLVDYVYQGEFFGLERKYKKAIICKGEMK